MCRVSTAPRPAHRHPPHAGSRAGTCIVVDSPAASLGASFQGSVSSLAELPRWDTIQCPAMCRLQMKALDGHYGGTLPCDSHPVFTLMYDEEQRAPT